MQLNANGHDIHYTLQGPDDAPLLMLSHSLATNAGMWAAQAALASSHRLLCYDTRGHGASGTPPGPYSLELLAADAAALLDALGIARVHWVGISMGGMIGQAFALAFPQRLHSLTLCATLCRFPPAAASDWEARIATARDESMAALVAPTIERWFSSNFATSQAAVVEPIRAMIRATPVAGYVACCQAIMRLDYRARLGEITVPTLVLVGEDDPSTPVAASREIHALIEGAQLSVIPGARHLCNIEQAASFNARLREFLRHAASG